MRTCHNITLYVHCLSCLFSTMMQQIYPICCYSPTGPRAVITQANTTFYPEGECSCFHRNFGFTYQKRWCYNPEDDNYNHIIWRRRQQLRPKCWYPTARLNSVVTEKLHSKLQCFALKTWAEWSSETSEPSVKLHGVITQAKGYERSQTNTMKKEEAFSFVTLETNYL